jgi:hypothetical protein
MIEAILCLALAQYDPIPPDCVETYQCHTSYTNLSRVHGEPGWPGYYHVLTWKLGVHKPYYACCDADFVTAEFCIATTQHYADRDNWDWEVIGDPLYIEFSNPIYTVDNPQHEFTAIYHPHLADVQVGDPVWGPVDPYNPTARFTFGKRIGHYDGIHLDETHEDYIQRINAISMAADLTLGSVNCPWDLDDDGTVNNDDFLLMLADWVSEENPHGHDVLDFMALLAHWGGCPNT